MRQVWGGKPLFYAMVSHICNIKKLNHMNEKENELSNGFCCCKEVLIVSHTSSIAVIM
jgi:hypothetical protein